MRTSSQESQVIWREIVGLATQVGEVKGQVAFATARITRLEDRLMAQQPSDPHQRFIATATAWGRFKTAMHAWGQFAHHLTPLGKIALWLTPRALLAYGMMSGWSSSVMTWLQRIIELI